MNKIKNEEIPVIIKIILAITSLIFLYTAGLGTFSALTQRSLLLTLMIPAILSVYKVSDVLIKRILNYILIGMGIVSGVYVIMVWPERILRIGAIPLTDIIMGTLMVIVILEITRRTTGLFLALTTLFFIVYGLFGPYFPSFMKHRGESWSRIINFLYLTTEGIFGIPLGIAATFIMVFIIFGAFLQTFGGGQWFIDMSLAIAGKRRGGPAKTAIFASGLMGMLSGASAANVVTTGTFTIPLMKKIGYSSEDAAAIEASASTAGLFTPPIMGAAAFIIAEYLRVPYLDIVYAAVIPAALFYLSIYLTVDSKAVKNGMSGLEASKLPNLVKVMKTRGHLGIPLIILIVGLVMGWTPMKAAFWSTLLVIAVAFLKSETRPDLKKLFLALSKGSYQAMPVISACASAGIIVGIISLTGLGTKLSYTLMSVAGEQLFVAAFITMILSLILGCAMPPTAVYIILAAILVEPLVQLGALPIAAHLFIFMSSAFGAITPPVAITAYAGAGIAEADPSITGFKAFKISIVGYIIPYIFLYSPSLIFQSNDLMSIIMIIVSSIIGIFALVASLEGYMFTYWRKYTRFILAISSVLLFWPGLMTNLVGVAGLIVSFVINKSVEKAVAVQNSN